MNDLILSNLTPYVSTHFRITKPLTGSRSVDTTLGKVYKISTWSEEDHLEFIDDAGEHRFWMLRRIKDGFLEDCSFEQNLKKVLK